MSRAPLAARDRARLRFAGARSATRPRKSQPARAPRAGATREQARGGPSRPARGARRVPRAAWMCALIAFLNATAWSLITPPFQGRDEVDHFAYVAQLAETGRCPNGQDGKGAVLSRRDARHGGPALRRR